MRSLHAFLSVSLSNLHSDDQELVALTKGNPGVSTTVNKNFSPRFTGESTSSDRDQSSRELAEAEEEEPKDETLASTSGEVVGGRERF